MIKLDKGFTDSSASFTTDLKCSVLAGGEVIEILVGAVITIVSVKLESTGLELELEMQSV